VLWYKSKKIEFKKKVLRYFGYTDLAEI